MKKCMIGIFAHPDDEAFGPSGTLLKLRDENYDIHLILLTDGEAGANPDAAPDLASTRLAEWQHAASLLGATSTHALHHPDGGLQQVPIDTLDHAVQTIISNIITTYHKPVRLSFMTFEPHGLTGHHDHIVASQLTTQIAQQYETQAVWYFCLNSSQAPLEGTAYYEPRGREDSYITTRIDISQYLETKHYIIDTHVSQRADGAAIKTLDDTTAECFHVDLF